MPAEPAGILAESVAISGEAVLIGLLVLLALGVAGVATIAALVYLGARLGSWTLHRDDRLAAGADARSEAPLHAQVRGEAVVPAVPYHLIGDRGARRRSRRWPLAGWVWASTTVISIGVIVVLPPLWFLGVVIAPLLGAAGGELTRWIDQKSSTGWI